MTYNQRISLFAERWPAACAAQGWDANDRAFRLDVISQAVGRRITSARQLNNTVDIDRVYAHLGMLATNVAATIETLPVPAIIVSAGIDRDGHPKRISTPDSEGLRRRYLWLIRKHAAPLGGDPYALRLARDKFGVTRGLTTLADLDGPQLHQLMITLHVRHRARAAKTSAPDPESAEAAVIHSNNPF